MAAFGLTARLAQAAKSLGEKQTNTRYLSFDEFGYLKRQDENPFDVNMETGLGQ